MILPRSGRTAWSVRSRPCLAEPPAESPSTRKSSRYCGIALRAVGELGGQPLVVEALLARQLARLARRLAGLGRPHALVDDLAGGRRVFLEGLGQLVVDDLLDEALDVGVAELGLGLPSNCGSGRRTETTAVSPRARRRR